MRWFGDRARTLGGSSKGLRDLYSVDESGTTLRGGSCALAQGSVGAPVVPMIWALTDRAAPEARAIADRHYNRQKVGARQFVPPGRCIVLDHPHALWITSWPFAEYAKHEWAGAWICSAFRNEGAGRSSDLIREAVAATRAIFGEPPALGMVTFVDPSKVRKKRDPGRCFIRAGFRVVGATRDKHLIALQLLPADMPEAQPPLGLTLELAI